MVHCVVGVMLPLPVQILHSVASFAVMQ